MRRLNFQVLGIDPANKGACLMLAALRQELGRRFPGARVAMDISTPFEIPFEERLRLGVWAVTPADWDEGRGFKALKGLAVRRMSGQARKMGLLHRSEIDVILDASGFAYGDFWGKAKFDRRLGAPMAGWKAAGKVVIALPQAWGAFAEPGFAETVQSTLAQADLVMARDAESLAHLQATGLAGVERAPDFTNLLAPALPPAFEDLRGAGFVIPNSKMLEARGEGALESYLGFLEQAVACLRRACPQVHILMHEGKKDRALAERLNDRLADPLRIIDVADPLETKAILAAASALVSSRFHGLVSALSAGVPSLACGWSHKYAELMADYGAADHVAQLGTPENWEAGFAAFSRDIADPGFHARLAEAAKAQKALAAASWDRIAGVIAAGTGVAAVAA